MIDEKDIELSYDVYYYYDKIIDRFISMSKLDEGIRLKGIENDVEVFEIFTPATSVDTYVNNWIVKNRKKH